MAFIMLRYVLSKSTLFRVFIPNECSILSNAFFAIIEVIIFYFYFCFCVLKRERAQGGVGGGKTRVERGEGGCMLSAEPAAMGLKSHNHEIMT